MSSSSAATNFSNDEAKSAIKEKILTSFNDLTTLTKTIVKSSKNQEAAYLIHIWLMDLFCKNLFLQDVLDLKKTQKL